MREVVASPLLESEPQLDAHAASSVGEPARERERVVARRDRPRCPFLLDDGEDTSDLRARLETQLVATDERSRRIGETSRLDDADELERTDERERVEGPRLGVAPEPMDRAR